jgi:hypothetical protein
MTNMLNSYFSFRYYTEVNNVQVCVRPNQVVPSNLTAVTQTTTIIRTVTFSELNWVCCVSVRRSQLSPAWTSATRRRRFIIILSSSTVTTTLVSSHLTVFHIVKDCLHAIRHPHGETHLFTHIAWLNDWQVFVGGWSSRSSCLIVTRTRNLRPTHSVVSMVTRPETCT